MHRRVNAYLCLVSFFVGMPGSGPNERAPAGEVGAEGTRFGDGFIPIGETLPVIGGVVGRAVAAARAVILR